MKERLMMILIGIAVKRLDAAAFKKFADMGLDFIEDYVANTPNKYDDLVVLPLCKTIRAAFDIPDDDEPEVVPEKLN